VLPRLAVDPRYAVATRPLVGAPRRQITAALRRGATSRVAVDRTLTALTEAAASVVPAEPG
jgi:hypothetical protein